MVRKFNRPQSAVVCLSRFFASIFVRCDNDDVVAIAQVNRIPLGCLQGKTYFFISKIENKIGNKAGVGATLRHSYLTSPGIFMEEIQSVRRIRRSVLRNRPFESGIWILRLRLETLFITQSDF